MAKRYTQAEWARIQSRLPQEDRVPYSQSPDLPATPLEQLQQSVLPSGIDPYYVRDPKTGLSPAQVEARAAQAAAKTGAAEVAAATGAKINPKTGMLTPSTIRVSTPVVTDPNAAAALAAKQAADLAAEEKRRAGQSAYSLLFSEFERYGLGALVEDLKGFIVQGLSPAEFTLKLRETPAYQRRFSANTQRIGKGLRALSEAEYIGLEDQYQNIMRQYGLPESYYAQSVDPKTGIKTQPGFEKFIAGDVSAAELEDRIATAQNRVVNAAPEVAQSLREFYPDITNGDILAYALDPEQALTNIKRKVTSAEIGAGARQAGLTTGLSRAEELQRYGVTGEQARAGFQAVAGVLPRASMLADIYAKQEVGPYTQTTAEQEVFGLAGATEAQRKRQKLTQLEQAQFAGSSGAAGGALSRERAGSF